MGFPEDSLSSDETLLLHTRTHWKAMIGGIVWLLLGVVGAILLLTLFDVTALSWVALALIVLVGGWFFLSPFARWYSSTYTVTDRRIITRTGLINQTGREIPLKRVSGVSYDKGALDRMFGCGTLKVESSAETTSVIFNDVPNVEQVQHMLSELIAKQPG